MALSEEEVQQVLNDIIKEAALQIPIEAVVHREDYADYLVVVGKVHYTDLREKLVDDYKRTKHGDFRNEILYKLKNPFTLDEFQRVELGIDEVPTDQKIELEKEKDDWV